MTLYCGGRITVDQQAGSDGVIARIASRRGLWATGRTDAEAIGRLVIDNPEWIDVRERPTDDSPTMVELQRSGQRAVDGQ